MKRRPGLPPSPHNRLHDLSRWKSSITAIFRRAITAWRWHAPLRLDRKNLAPAALCIWCTTRKITLIKRLSGKMIREKLVLKITGGNRMTVALARVLAVAWIFAASSGASAEEGGRGVKIGIMSDVSGPAASNSGTGSTLAAKMAIEDFGENVLGKPVETVTADFQLK